MSSRKNANVSKARVPEPPDLVTVGANSMKLLQASTNNNIRNWRVFRGVKTQGELAELTKGYDPSGKGLTRATVCRLESGELRWNEDQIIMLSQTLRVQPRDLIGTNPFNSGDIFAIYAGLSERKQKQAIKLIQQLIPL